MLKDLKAALDLKAREKYEKLTDKQCLELLLERKWYRTLVNRVYTLYSSVSHRITERIYEFAERYEQTLPKLENEVKELEGKVKSHLEKMGFVW